VSPTHLTTLWWSCGRCRGQKSDGTWLLGKGAPKSLSAIRLASLRRYHLPPPAQTRLCGHRVVLILNALWVGNTLGKGCIYPTETPLHHDPWPDAFITAPCGEREAKEATLAHGAADRPVRVAAASPLAAVEARRMDGERWPTRPACQARSTQTITS
jgi:hypothetical protein